MKKPEETDWIGKWFAVAQELGGDHRASGGRADTVSGQTEWTVIDHENEDGLGWLCSSLRKRGYHIPEIPESKVLNKPPVYQRPMIFYRTLRNISSRPIPWKEFDPERKRVFRKEFDWIYFSKDETDRISRYAKTQGASINSFFIKIFNDVIVSELIDGPFESAWMFPINMRGNVKLSRDTANHSSTIMIRTTEKTTAQDIKMQIKDNLKKNIHWGSWWLGNIGKIVGLRGMKMVSRYSQKRSFYLGTFSSFGQWPLPGSERQLNPNEVWFAAPTGSPNYPIGSDNITWHGKFTLSLKIHPSILSDQRRIPEFLAQIKEVALGLTGQ